MASATLETAAATVRAVCVPYSEISSSKLDVISEIIQTPTLTDDQLVGIREVIHNSNATVEPPMSIEDACRLLGNRRDENGEIIPISKAALHYHVRAGHIRRCAVAGAARGRGVVAADVRAIVEGKGRAA